MLVDQTSGRVLGQGHNGLVQEGNPIAHGEMAALRAAGRLANRHRTTLYTTLQPCFMCAGTIAQFGIPRVVIGDVENASSDETLRFLPARGVEVVVLVAGVGGARLCRAGEELSRRAARPLAGGLGRRAEPGAGSRLRRGLAAPDRVRQPTAPVVAADNARVRCVRRARDAVTRRMNPKPLVDPSAARWRRPVAGLTTSGRKRSTPPRRCRSAPASMSSNCWACSARAASAQSTSRATRRCCATSAIKESVRQVRLPGGRRAGSAAQRCRGIELRYGLRSFIQEARLLAGFDHPSLVKVHRFWEGNGTAYMAMPHYRGRTLKEVRQTMVGAPDEAMLRALLEPLLSALAVLHDASVYHRDVSPDNIVLQPDGVPVLLDFGCARRWCTIARRR